MYTSVKTKNLRRDVRIRLKANQEFFLKNRIRKKSHFCGFFNSPEPKFAILFYQRLSVIRPSVLPSAKCIKLFIVLLLQKLLAYIPPNLVQSILMKRGIKFF